MRLSLDMSLEDGEFRRLLPGAVGQAPVETGPGAFTGAFGSGRWTLVLEPLPDRRLGSLSLPTRRVVLTLEGIDAAEAEAFLARFHRGFQRGGG